MSLSSKERRFVVAYAHHNDAAEAAREAGYKDKVGTRTAKRILAKPEAQAFLAECLSSGQERDNAQQKAKSTGKQSIVSLASLTEELEEARSRAVDAGQSSAAIAATMGKAKLHGLDHPKKKPPSRKSPEKIERVIVDPKDSDG